VVLLAVGAAIFRDYGISWDESFQRKYGQQVYAYVTQGSQEMLEGPMKYYGPAFELGLLAFEKILRLADTRSIYFMRHFLTFLTFWLATIFFYELCRYVFRSWKIGLLGALLLVLSPRMLGESFYNPKDLPFMALFAISMYTLVRYIDAKTIRWAVAHAIACAVLVDIRIVGLLVPVFTIGFVAFGLVSARREPATVRKYALSLSAFLVVAGALIVLLWPTLWHRPLYHLVQAFKEMSHYPMGNPILYRGHYVRPQDVPWHYAPVWIAISTPLVQIAGFILGCLVSLRLLVGWFAGDGAKRARPDGSVAGVISTRNLLVLVLWFFVPVLYVILSRAALFDGWRHMYFVYPGFVGISVVGFVGTFRLLKTSLKPRASRAAITALIVVVVLGLAYVVRTMVRYHPYEHLYFNALTGGTHGADGRYDLDYWGLSYRQGLEYILKTDKAPVVTVCAHTRPGMVNSEILPAQDRQRLRFVKNAYDATYYLTDLRWDTADYTPEEIVHVISVDRAKIMMVVRVMP
jgi:hypothetical protein